MNHEEIAKNLSDNIDSALFDQYGAEWKRRAEQAEAENDELRAALQLFANEIYQRRMFGFVQDAVFEAVSNNQICRTALTDTGYKGVK